MREAVHLWLARLAAVFVAAGSTLAFPEPSWWWLGWFGLAPVLGILARSPTSGEALIRSWMAGVGFLTALHYWVIPHTGAFTLVLSAFMGLFWLPLGAATRWTLGGGPRRRWAAVVVVPSVWVVIEAVRSWEYFGGTWGLMGLSQWRAPILLQGAALGGVWLLSFTMVAVNVALAAAVLSDRGGGERILALGTAGAVLALLAAFGAARAEAPTTGTVSIAGVQAGVFEEAAPRLDAHLELTRSLENGTYDFVVWGQTSVAFDPSRVPDVDRRLRSVVSAAGADLLVNVDQQTPRGIVKTTLLYTPDGPVADYGKQRLVPFGEYIPLRPLLGWVSDYTEAATQDRARGEGATVMSVAGVEVGPLISYESTFPDMRRRLARLDADLTIVQGGTQTFQGTWAQPQQASYEAVNAVASGRPAVLVAVSGTSAAFDARGHRLAWYPAEWTGGFVVEVPLSREDTPYVLLGDWVVWLSGVVTLVAIGRWVVERIRMRSGARAVTRG